MNLNLTAKLRARHRKVLVGSIAALGLAGSVLGRDVTWNGPLISVDGGAEMPWDGVLNSVGSMDDVTLKASTVVTLAGSGSTVLENAILNSSLGQPGVTTLTINSTDATSRTLVSAVTTLAGASGQSLVIAGSADFRTGFLSDGGFGNVQLVKDGGTGELILDGLSNDPNANDLDGALLRVVTGTISVEGGGGTASPISSLVQSIRIDNAAGKLRLGTPNGTATTFGNSLLVNESGTLEHTAASNDLLTGGVLIQTGKILTTNITGGSLTLAGSVAVGGLNKTGAATLILSGVNTYTGATAVSAGTFAVAGSLGNTVITVSPGATFSARPGSGIGYAGTSLTVGTSGLTLSGGATSAASFNMVDDAVGTFRLGSGGLTTLTGTVKPTFTFEIGSTLGSIDRLDLATMGGNAVIAAGTKVSFAGLSSATTLAVGNYTFLTTAANGLGPVAFTLASNTVTVGSTTYNLSLANSTATQEILTISGGTISNNSVIAVAPVNLSFGRVLATAIGTRNLTVSRASGTSNTGATAAVTGGAAGATLSSTASGAGFITGSQNWVINVGLNPGLGAHSDTVAVANTGNDGSGSAPGGPGQGNSQLPINIAVSGSVLALRSVTAAPLLLGRQLAATNLNSLTESVTFNSSGTHADTTDVTVDGNPGFNGASNTLNKSITGQNAVISASGTFYTASVASGETGLGDTYAGVPVSYTATPLALRSVTATPVALGRQLATTHLSGFSRTVTLVSSGSHNDTTDVTVDGSLMFNGTNNTQNLVISGQSGVIAASGTFYSAPVVSDETGLGDTYGNVAVSYTATPLALRLVTSATVSLGRQLAATNLNNITRTVTFNSTGTHAGTTDVTVDGSLLFNGVGNSLTKMLTGQNAVIGANGTYYGASVVSGESGLGDTYGNVAVSYTATPLALRSVTGATVLLGRQLATANLNSFSKSVTFNSSGLHGDTTDVTVDGSLVFNGGSNVMSKTIAGQNAVIGAGGSYYSAPVASGESGLGDTYGNVTVSYMATPLALRSVTGTVGDLGRVMGGTNLGTLSRSVTFDSVGTHEAVTDVMVDGTLLFTGGSNSLSKNVTGPNETVGAGGVFYSAPVLSGEVGLGDTYANVTVGYTATPLQDRVVAADTVDFGLVHVGAAVGGATTLRTTGDNSARTAISVGNASGGGFSLAGGANPVFNDAAVTDARTLAGTLGTAGAFANVAALTLLPGTEAGIAGVQIPVAVEVRYSADVFSGSARWNGADSGSWGTAASASWIDTLTASIHAAPGTFSAAFAGTDRAVFNAAASGTVNLDGATPSLAAVTFSGGSHTIAAGVGAGALTLKSDAGPATVTVSGVIQSITAPVVFGSDVTATVTQAADFLTWSGGIDGAGKTLTKDGDGMLTLAGPQNYAALEANQGVTNLDSALGTGSSVLHANAMVNIHASQTLAALVIGDGATVTFGDGLSFAAAAEKSGGVVPEPGALALLLVGVLGVLGQRRR